MKKQNERGAVVVAEAMVPGTITGTLSGFAPSGEPLVGVPGEDAPVSLRARTCMALGSRDVGRTAVLMFEASHPDSPIIIGLLQPPRREKPTEVDVDGRTILLTGQETIELRCGEASITLNRDGKVVIRGHHVVSHASGVNRIRGGSVQLN